MAKNILWYNMADHSHGGCAAHDMLIVDADDITPEEGRALYEASTDSDENLPDLMLSIYYRQNPEEEPCG
jgi:hypothetical protein